MPLPKYKIHIRQKTSANQTRSLTKMALNILETAMDKDDYVSDHSSGDESDETIINSELLKIPNEPGIGVMSDEETNSEITNDSNDGELADDEKSTLSSQSLSVSAESEQFSPPRPPSIGITTNVTHDIELERTKHNPKTGKPSIIDQPKDITNQGNKASTSKVSQDKTETRSQRSILAQIKETNKLKKAVDKEIRNRKKALKQQLMSKPTTENVTSAPTATVSGPIASGPLVPTFGSTNKQPKVKPMPPTDSRNSHDPPPMTVSHFTRIPRLLLKSSIVNSAVQRVAKRKRLTTSYSVLSEILSVKQILAKGNPFRVIPQHAYDISRVPGIRLPHIQQLLKQWEAYFSNILYQIIQMEYSIEYGDVERRITAMVEGAETYGALCEFQSFVGKDEVSVKCFKSGGFGNKHVDKENEPVPKKSKSDDKSEDNPNVAGTSGQSGSKRRPLIEH